eukprot:2014408-Pyramimonas_sp.AAC.1
MGTVDFPCDGGEHPEQAEIELRLARITFRIRRVSPDTTAERNAAIATELNEAWARRDHAT